MQIHGLVYDMDASLVEVGTNQRHANHGIYILCKAVGELMAGHNIPSKAELIEYTQHPIWHGDRLQVCSVRWVGGALSRANSVR